MNQRIQKVIDEIGRTKTRIAELQALLPELERKRVEMENSEIIRLVRSASIVAADLPEFLETLKTAGAAAPEPVTTQPPAPEAGDEKTTFIKEDDTDA